MVLKKILEYLDEEVERHKEQENEESTSWGRGFENGSMTEAIQLRVKIRELMMGECGL